MIIEYKRKPLVVDIFQNLKSDVANLPRWVKEEMENNTILLDKNTMTIKIDNNTYLVDEGDYITRDPYGKISLCKKDDFRKEYEVLNIKNSQKQRVVANYEIGNFREFLFDLYHVQKLSTVEISKMLNVGSTTVSQWLKEYGIATKRYNKPNKIIKKDGFYEVELYDYFANVVATCKISLGDYDLIKKYIWSLSYSGYATTHTYKKSTKSMHRLILNLSDDHIVDHINRNKLDNRRENLRIATPSDNSRNITIPSTNSSGIIGVNFRGDTERWRAYIKVDSVSKSLGSYRNKDDAIRARLRAEQEHFGQYAPQKHLYDEYLKEGQYDKSN